MRLGRLRLLRSLDEPNRIVSEDRLEEEEEEEEEEEKDGEGSARAASQRASRLFRGTLRSATMFFR